MKKAKLILTCVAILAVVGGALAFKANKFLPRNVYSLLPGNKISTINVGGIIYQTTVPNCTWTAFRTADNGVERSDFSTTTTAAASTTLFTSAGHTPVPTTFEYCTATVTKVLPADN